VNAKNLPWVALASAVAALLIIGIAAQAAGSGANPPTPDATATATTATATPSPDGANPPPAQPTATVQLVYNPCESRISVGGQPFIATLSFKLADIEWQMCIGGAAAGSSGKLLFKTRDGGSHWDLISQTADNPSAGPGVGLLPNGNAAEALFFTDEQHGWLGLSSPGANLFRTTDGGANWIDVPVLPPGVPVLGISFADASHGSVTTPEGGWTTADGGQSWSQVP